MKSYRVLERGLEWTADGEQLRAEPGEIRSDLIEADVPELIKAGLIEETDAKKPTPARRNKGAKKNG
jgi:hypothetical protein